MLGTSRNWLELGYIKARPYYELAMPKDPSWSVFLLLKWIFWPLWPPKDFTQVMCAPAARWMSEHVTLAFWMPVSGGRMQLTCSFVYFVLSLLQIIRFCVMICNDMICGHIFGTFMKKNTPESCCFSHLWTSTSNPLAVLFGKQHKWRCPAWVMPRSHRLHHNRSIDDFLPFFLMQPALPWAYGIFYSSHLGRQRWGPFSGWQPNATKGGLGCQSSMSFLA